MAEDDLKKLIGQPMSKSTVVVERGPVANFALAVGDRNPVYRDPRAAEEAGFPAIPAPPTWPFVMMSWGEFAEVQPTDKPKANAMAEVIGPLMAGGGLILHGEQEFTYHRPVFVGDVLEGEGTVVDAYAKESKGRTMTFIVIETLWKDTTNGEPVVSSKFNLIHRS
jgi:acyl dehydratase